MTHSIIAIKGNHIYNVVEIFECFKYNVLEPDKLFDSYSQFNAYLFDNYHEFTSRDIALRGIWENNGWTFICDPEMVDITNTELLLKFSEKLSSSVLTFIIQTNSNSFGFAKYNKTVQRSFFVSNGEIAENIGTPTTEELGLNLNEKTSVDDILKLAENIQLNIEMSSNKFFIVKQLGYSEELKKEVEIFSRLPINQTKEEKKAWWKIW